MTVPPHLHRMLVDLLVAGRVILGPHVLVHGLAEGFGLRDVRVAVRNGIIIEVYADRSRCLLCARVRFRDGRLRWLHVVCSYAVRNELGLVTAYVPDPTEWDDPPIKRRTI